MFQLHKHCLSAHAGSCCRNCNAVVANGPSYRPTQVTCRNMGSNQKVLVSKYLITARILRNIVAMKWHVECSSRKGGPSDEISIGRL